MTVLFSELHSFLIWGSKLISQWGPGKWLKGVTGDNETGKVRTGRNPTLCSHWKDRVSSAPISGLPELTEIYVSISYKFLKWNQKSRYNIWMFPRPSGQPVWVPPCFHLALVPQLTGEPSSEKKPVFHGSTQHRPCGIHEAISALRPSTTTPGEWDLHQRQKWKINFWFLTFSCNGNDKFQETTNFLTASSQTKSCLAPFS